MSGPVAVSVVVPLLDEAETVPELVERLRRTLEGTGRTFELVFVDDGSRDATAAWLRELEADDARLRVIEFTRNFGQAAALACGIFHTRGDVVVTLDGDLQNPPEEVATLLEAVDKGAWVVSARRAQRYEPGWRWLGSRFVHVLARVLVGTRIEDYGGQFKAYRREVVEAMRGAWAPGKPFFPLALWLGFPAAEVSVRHERRRAGDSRYTLATLVRVNLDLLTSFTTTPLVLMAFAGAAVLALGGLGTVASLWLRPEILAPLLVSLTLLLVGAILTAAGVVGVYLARVYKRVAGTPGFVIRSGPLREAPGPPREDA